MRNASLEDCQLLAESEILQRNLFVAAKDKKDHPKKREDCVQHEAGSVSASSLKINRLRDRWDLARHSHRGTKFIPKNGRTFDLQAESEFTDVRRRPLARVSRL